MGKHPLPLTMLTEEDEAFRAAVNKFAESKLKPKINVRLSPQLHSEIASADAKAGKSLNQWIINTLDQATDTDNG